MLGGTEISARGSLGWRHAFDKITPTSTLSFQGGLPFAVAGVPVARDAAMIEGGVDMKVSPSARLGLSYQGQFSQGAQQNRLNARFNLAF
jgi:outer membrane autotransporter protein